MSERARAGWWTGYSSEVVHFDRSCPSIRSADPPPSEVRENANGSWSLASDSPAAWRLRPCARCGAAR